VPPVPPLPPTPGDEPPDPPGFLSPVVGVQPPAANSAEARKS
jgi:hypothetical protein